MKKYLLHSLALTFVATALVACGGNDNNNDMNPPEDDMEMNEPGEGNVENQHYGMDEHGDENHMTVSGEVADSVRELDGVNHAAAIVMGGQAYVAVTMDDESHDISDDMKQKVADKAMEVDHNLNNVHVSSNPDFVERMNGYGDRIENGEPVSGFADEFMEMVHRMFPSTKR
ncbi:YhcN/YlaJ family sporulation lipoprotein [Shouchella sp. 1P09AA]|uniref:YhcN/YlaJ family sporulation lipoprotein n=1 Tax=unclassified Shouchella TaxID=2893065 RepID=UPI0039A037FB